jgi:hypothetical protein
MQKFQALGAEANPSDFVDGSNSGAKTRGKFAYRAP